MFMSQETKDRLCRLLSYDSFTWQELHAIIGNDAQCVKVLNEQFEREGRYPHLRQPLGEDGEIPENSVWDGMFALLDGMPVYIGADGPSGGSRGPVGRYMHVWPTSVIEMY